MMVSRRVCEQAADKQLDAVQGCAFDKDNTLTLPFLKEVYPEIQASLDECKEAFNGKIVLFSNSAGLKQFDPDGALHSALPSVMLGFHSVLP